ncbi:MAG: peptide-binding protein [Candidatus Muiribacterium halophilum]|uniref:Peptide-binding protein n=1 Tax=Muiribacterium halophilum TaxID=2053465 RepID=A0A2N5ZMU3_MUIH1|nr:MAG: peptide-binding protein [Candidatus Muirbacterium halophilum]
MKNKKNILLITMMLLVLLTGCTKETQPTDIKQETDKDLEPNYGGTYIEASIADAITLNPLLYTDSPSGNVISMIFSGLIKYDPNNQIEANMAKSYEVKKNEDVLYVHLSTKSPIDANKLKETFMKKRKEFAPVKKTQVYKGIDSDRDLILEVNYENAVKEEEKEKWKKLSESIEFVDYKYSLLFHLRDDIKWSDGRDFTSADVIFTYDKVICPDTQCPRKSNYKMIKSVEAPDRYTVKVDYFIPFAPALQSWMMRIIPKHILENEDLLETRFNRSPVGTGPYKLLQWNADEFILLEANDKYFKGKSYIDKVMIKIIPDKSQQFLDLKNGLIDFMGMTSDQYKKQADTLEFKERFNIYKLPSSRYYSFVGYNCARKPFDNKKVRQALSYAIDVNSLIDNIFYGFGKKVTGPFPIISWAYNPNAQSYDYNPEKAKELLAEAGYDKKDKDGFLINSEGKRLSIKLITNNANKEREYMVTIINDYWKAIGIESKIGFEEWGQFLKLQDKGDFDAVLLGWNLANDPDIYNIWHSSNIPNKDHPSSFNFQRYSNPKVDKLLEEARYTFDQEKRKECYWKIHELIAEDQPYTFLIAEDSFSVLDKRFKNVYVKGNSIFHNFTKWFVPKDQIKYK